MNRDAHLVLEIRLSPAFFCLVCRALYYSALLFLDYFLRISCSQSGTAQFHTVSRRKLQRLLASKYCISLPNVGQRIVVYAALLISIIYLVQ